MKKIVFLTLTAVFASAAGAQWYWPFGSSEKDASGSAAQEASDGDGKKQLRLSELMETASLAIDDAADLSDSGKITEAIAKYSEAIAELDRIERKYPERAKTSEFSTLRTKRAYSRSAIASLRMKEALINAKPVAVTDTAALEKKLAEERAAKEKALAERKAAREKALAERKAAKEKKEAELRTPPRTKEKAVKEKVSVPTQTSESTNAVEKTVQSTVKEQGLLCAFLITDPAPDKSPGPTSPLRSERSPASGKPGNAEPRQASSEKAPAAGSLRERAIACINRGDHAAAHDVIGRMLKDAPGDALALNLLAAVYKAEGKTREAEAVLFKCMTANKNVFCTYYNMARLCLGKNPPDVSGAKYYYETGRSHGGPRDQDIERKLK